MGVVRPDSIWWASRKPEDGDDETWTCPVCRHCFERWFDVNTMSYRLSRPLDPILWEHACKDCRGRLLQRGVRAPADRPKAKAAAKVPGAIIPGVNTDA